MVMNETKTICYDDLFLTCNQCISMCSSTKSIRCKVIGYRNKISDLVSESKGCLLVMNESYYDVTLLTFV